MKLNAANLFCFGLGYSAQVLARRLIGEGWSVAGTCREQAQVAELRALGVDAVRFERHHMAPEIPSMLGQATHVLSSVPPDGDGDPVLDCFEEAIVALAGSMEWAGYLSTTGVYGDRGGATVTETDDLDPGSQRSRRRALAEGRWLALAGAGLPVHAFRLAGIYGPGRNVLDDIRAGRARRIEKPGHMFSRIHVDDLASVLIASMARPDAGAIYNVCDDEPAGPADVVAHGCALLGVEAPPPQSFAQAEPQMSPMQRSFWADNKRLDNSRLKTDLGVRLAYPTYRQGLQACLQDS